MGVIESDVCVSFLKIELIGRKHAATAHAGHSTVARCAPLLLAANCQWLHEQTQNHQHQHHSSSSQKWSELCQSLCVAPIDPGFPTLTNYLFHST
jgi:hypothetical protein